MPAKIVRNIGVIAHVDAGKTTATERILYYTGKSHRVGEVHDGTATMDFDPQERTRGITINSAATTVFWHGAQINIIDTPGHIDFNIEVNRSLRVLDGAVVLFDAVEGVEPQTETNWRLADRYRVPRICFINKLDRVGADFDRAVRMIEERLAVKPLVLHLPIGAEGDFHGLVDVLSLRALVWHSDEIGQPYTEEAIPAHLVERATALRAQLIETVVDQDEAALDAYVRGEELTPDALRACIRKGTLAGSFYPVLAGAAFKNKGIEPLLDAIVDYLPQPGEVSPKAGQPEADPDGPFAALAFKVVTDEHGVLVYVRVYRGRLRRGDLMLNTSTQKQERAARLYEIHADRREERTELQAGDIAAIGGLKETLTGHTLCAPRHPLVLEQIKVPEPVIDVAIEPKTLADQHNLSKALHALERDDPSLHVSHDAESGQTILSGMGELQLEVAVENLRAKHHVGVAVGRPQVAYRETIKRTKELTYVHKKQTGGPGQFAEVVLRLEPLARGSGIRFDSKITAGAIPREYIPSVESGVRHAARAGVLGGYPVVDVGITLVNGSYHERDSSTVAFEIAGAAAFRDALRAAEPTLLEPVMAVEVITPLEYLGDCIGDLQRRHGVIRHQENRGNAAVIDAHVPLREMFGYIGDLRSLSSGRAHYSMQLDHYAEAPPRANAMTF